MPTTGLATAWSEAQDSLDCSFSGRHSEADLSKLGDELGISAGPTDAEAAAAAAAVQPRDGKMLPTNNGAGDITDGGRVQNLSASTSAAVAAAAAAAAASAAAAAASAGEGEGTNGPATEEGEGGADPAHRRNKDNRASFDGYDFNTLRKVGSLRMGGAPKNQGSVPELAAARSMDARGSKPP